MAVQSRPAGGVGADIYVNQHVDAVSCESRHGTSLSTTVGAANIAGEVLVCIHALLSSESGVAGIEMDSNIGDANSDPIYSVDSVMVRLLNAIYDSPALTLDPGRSSQ
jgi:hypothetical protein